MSDGMALYCSPSRRTASPLSQVLLELVRFLGVTNLREIFARAIFWTHVFSQTKEHALSPGLASALC